MPARLPDYPGTSLKTDTPFLRMTSPRLHLFATACSLAFLAGSAHALDFETSGSTVTIKPCRIEIAGGPSVTIAAPAQALTVAPAPILTTRDEAVQLSVDKPAGYAKGTRLRAVNARDVNARGAFTPGSLTVRTAKGDAGELLQEGEDYLVDPAWAHLGLGPKSRVTARDTVFASYSYSQLRLDTIQVDAAGRVSLLAGQPHISAPVPPAAAPGQTAIAHVLVDYRSTAITRDQVYPILEAPARAVTASTAGRIPKTLAKLRAGEPVKIVCWGDSVTAGGNASQPANRYVDVFAAGLRERFPNAALDVQNISAGGSSSRQWLFPEKYPYHGLHGSENPARFERILEAKPDLVTIEFVNDAGLNAAGVEEAYSDILQRLAPLGTEVILITPHFTMLSMMGFKDMREPERRPYVLGLRDFAGKHQIALADASARWQHLAAEGLPYLTLLDNTINHPDDRGHRLFAEELWKCFQ